MFISFFVFRRIAAGMSVYRHALKRSTIKITFYAFFLKMSEKQGVKIHNASLRGASARRSNLAIIWIASLKRSQ
jgi:hypothetical protein